MQRLFARLVWDAQLTLGEGPVWDEREKRLYLVDIEGRRLLWLDLAGGGRGARDLPEKPGFLCLTQTSGRLLLGLASGLYAYDWPSGALRRLASLPDHRAGHRLNDGKVDPAGRLWFGTMAEDQQEGAGRVFVWDGRAVPRCLASGFTIPNGPAFSGDGTGYCADSPRGRVYRFDSDPDAFAARTTFLAFDPQDGHPDGMSVDAEGCLWQARYGAGCVTRHSPDGHLLLRIELPVAEVTACTFGGADLRTLFITTAAGSGSGGGGLYAYETGTPGLPSAHFALEAPDGA